MIMHLVPSGDRLTWCGLTAAAPGTLTVKLDHMSCKACRTALITRGVCPECGEEKLSWGVHPRNKSGVADGRLTMNDVETIFYLGCDFCSATLLAHVDPETVAAAITELRWRP